MGEMKTLPCLALLIASVAGPARSDETWADRFAACTGRLSAQMEHQWLLSDTRADQTKALRARMIEVLDAVTTEDSDVQLMALRLEAKYAHAALLNHATFGRDERYAAAAQALAEQSIALCVGLMIGNPAGERHASQSVRPERPESAKPARHR